MDIIDINIIAGQVAAAIRGEPLPEATSPEAQHYLAAVRQLLGHEETRAKDAAMNVVALAALAAFNNRLRAAAYCAMVVGSARRQ